MAPQSSEFAFPRDVQPSPACAAQRTRSAANRRTMRLIDDAGTIHGQS
jgi:hypothetical protein